VLSADLITEARRRAGLSQAELGRRTGRTQSAIARWERGAVEPGLSTLVELVRACGLDLTVGVARYDDSYLPHIDRVLALTPAERLARATQIARTWQSIRASVEAGRGG
jgi:uncharacterized protein